MGGSNDIQNRCYQALAELTAFADVGALNTGLPLALGEALGVELRFYATSADCADYELIGQRATRWADNSASELSQTASRLGSDRRLLNRLGRRDFCEYRAETGACSVFHYHISADCKVFIIVDAKLQQEQIDLVRAGLKIYANQVALLKRTTRDSLTNLLNRDAFERRMRSLYSRNGVYRRRSREPTCNGCFAIADIDNFKHVNDSFGHVCGDQVLVQFAQIMRDSFRDDDVLCRFGGEEFVIVLSDVDVAVAMKALRRFNNTVAETEFAQGVSVTVSLGCTQLNLGSSVDVMTARADKALYYAKTHGRNQLCYYEDLLATEKLEQDAELFA